MSGNYSNRHIYHHATGQYQLCSATNYSTLNNGCAGSVYQVPNLNFNTVGLYHNYSYNGCAFSNTTTPASITITLTAADSTHQQPTASGLGRYWCNYIIKKRVSVNIDYVEPGCGLALQVTDEPLQSTGFKIFPNPATDLLNVYSQRSGRVQVTNALGLTLADHEIPSDTSVQINLPANTEGLLMVKFIYSDKTETVKLIKLQR